MSLKNSLGRIVKQKQQDKPQEIYHHPWPWVSRETLGPKKLLPIISTSKKTHQKYENTKKPNMYSWLKSQGKTKLGALVNSFGVDFS